MRFWFVILLCVFYEVRITNAQATTPTFTYPTGMKTGRYVCTPGASGATVTFVVTYTGPAFSFMPTSTIGIAGLGTTMVMTAPYISLTFQSDVTSQLTTGFSITLYSFVVAGSWTFTSISFNFISIDMQFYTYNLLYNPFYFLKSDSVWRTFERTISPSKV